MDFLCQFNSSFPSVVIVSPKETTNSKDCLTCYESLHGVALGNLNVWWCDQVQMLHPYVEHLFLEGLSCMLRMKWSPGVWDFKLMFWFSPYLMSGASTGWLDKKVFSDLSVFYTFCPFHSRPCFSIQESLNFSHSYTHAKFSWKSKTDFV